MKSDTEGGGSNAGKDLGHRIEFSDYATSHQREHTAKECARRPPCEGVYGAESAKPPRNPSSAGDSRVDNQGDIFKVELFDNLGGPQEACSKLTAGLAKRSLCKL
jgi:hypothetical protein